MTEDDKKFEQELDFVASHYKHGAFSKTEAWRKLAGSDSLWQWKRKAVAAAVACFVIAASAFVYNIIKTSRPEKDADKIETTATVNPAVSDSAKSARLEFTDAPIQEVINVIEATYGVSVGNVPDTGDMRLTLSFEGSAEDIIDAINATCDTNLKIDNDDKNKAQKNNRE